jgi:hypothetical protein
MKIKFCRNCNSANLRKLFSLGRLKFTGKFLPKNKFIPSGVLELIICMNCKLIQLRNNFNPSYMYNNDYGYRTGINSTMISHVKKVVKKLSKIASIKKNDAVLDIASNDATLLNFYKKKSITTFGIDPLVNKFIKNYGQITYKISNFFSFKSVNSICPNIKFKIITALSVFYDLKEPNLFLEDIKKLLHPEGLLYIEFADLKSIIERNMFDTICHEHLEYYSSTVLINMLKKHKLRIFNQEYNTINGGSSAYYICHDQAKYNFNQKKLIKILKEEKKLGLSNFSTFINFKKKIDIIKLKLNLILKRLVNKNNKTIHAYGASTKGNVLLQYFKINNKILSYVAERNPNKYNLYTPGSNIKIISEKKSRSLKPDYYLVLPWHFREEILKREFLVRKKGTKFIFPLPQVEIL